MGRADCLPANPDAPIKLRLQKLRLIDGDYDQFGAYWGSGHGKTHIFCAWGEDDGAEILVFVRAANRAEAENLTRGKVPGALFYPSPAVKALRSFDSLDAFTRAYIECALWLHDEDAPGGDWAQTGRINQFAEILSNSCLLEMAADCSKFQSAHAALLSDAGTAEQNGHDFWLTRNGHGAGFWDRGYPDSIGDALTAAAEACGEVNIYAGYDGKIYCE